MPRRVREVRVSRTREPTAYNIFMGTAMRRIKLANPTMNAKDVMRAGASEWRSRK